MNNLTYLLVGDLHIQPASLEECFSLFEFIYDQAIKHSATPVFLGDVFDNHSNVHVDCLYAANHLFSLFPQSITIVGNHDANYESNKTTLMPFSNKTLLIFDKVVSISDALPTKIYGLGFRRNPKEFIDKIKDIDRPAVVFCHQTFLGAEMFNLYTDIDGIDSDLFRDIFFVSGHIHKTQTIKNTVFYTGTPRQINFSEKDQIPSVFIFNDKTIQRIEVPEHIAPRYKKIEIKNEEDFLSISFDSLNAKKTRIDVVGTKAFVEHIVKKIPSDFSCKVLIKEKLNSDFSENDIESSFKKYIDSYCEQNKLDCIKKNLILRQIEDIMK